VEPRNAISGAILSPASRAGKGKPDSGPCSFGRKFSSIMAWKATDSDQADSDPDRPWPDSCLMGSPIYPLECPAVARRPGGRGC